MVHAEKVQEPTDFRSYPKHLRSVSNTETRIGWSIGVETLQPLENYLKECRERIDGYLDRALGPQPGLPESLREAMRYSVLAPGKRLRPLLVVLASDATRGVLGLRSGNPWAAGCAVEMVHTYSLVHDDLPAMDDDDLRRGRPTCHKVFGEAMGILVGDALLTLAFQTLAETYPPRVASACVRVLARAAGPVGMVGGQVVDLAWEREPDPAARTLSDLEGVHTRKTGALIQASLLLGAYVAGVVESPEQGMTESLPPPEILDALTNFGRCLGLAFQITDDLLDVEGMEASTGKRVHKDAGRNKLTYPGLLGLQASRERAAALGKEGIAYLAVLGAEATRLCELMNLVLHRDR